MLYLNRHKSWLSMAMALLIFCSFGGRELHELLFHQHDGAVCEAQDGAIHFHGEEYLPDHCFLCTLNTTELSFDESITFTEMVWQSTSEAIHYISPSFTPTSFSFFLRGPPCFKDFIA